MLSSLSLIIFMYVTRVINKAFFFLVVFFFFCASLSEWEREASTLALLFFCVRMHYRSCNLPPTHFSSSGNSSSIGMSLVGGENCYEWLKEHFPLYRTIPIARAKKKSTIRALNNPTYVST